MKEYGKVSRSVMCFDIGYIRWPADFAPFEADCLDQLYEFVRLHFDDLIDRYYGGGHQTLHEFPDWAFERYLRKSERSATLR